MLSILIVNWNTRDLLHACLASLQTHLVMLKNEIIVVDCASNDGSVEMVARDFPAVTLLASNENLGFAHGNNLAFEKSSGDFVWLLNPDTEIEANSASAVLEFLEQHPPRRSSCFGFS